MDFRVRSRDFRFVIWKFRRWSPKHEPSRAATPETYEEATGITAPVVGRITSSRLDFGTYRSLHCHTAAHRLFRV